MSALCRFDYCGCTTSPVAFFSMKGVVIKEVFMKNNFVAKNANKFNKAVVFKDKKKALKRGYSKHNKKIDRNNQESYQIAA